MRPVFQVELARAPEPVIAALGRALDDGNHPVRGVAIPPNVDLRIPDADRHFWSPVLALRVLPEAGDRALLQGRFAPHPHVWMMFMAIYLVLAMIGVGGLMYGIAQSMLDRSPWALAAVPVAAAVAGFVYGASLIGQGLGAEQMYTLRTFVDHVLEAEGLSSTTADDPSRSA